MGFAPSADREKLAKRVVDDMIAKGYHSTCGNQGYRHMFYALSDMGYTEQLIKMITNPEYPGWGYMVASGATTVWERWEKEMQCEMHSFDHPMFSAYDGWLYEYLGGIKISDDAFACDKIVIAPQVTDGLDFVDCSIDTSRGKITSSWEKDGDYVEYKIQIPNGVTAQIRLNGKDEQTIKSGSYSFRLKNKV